MNLTKCLFTAGLALASCLAITSCDQPADYPQPQGRIKQIDADAITTAEQAITADKLMTSIEILSSDDFGGRAPMTDGETKTLAYVEQQFAAAGLQPLFSGSFRQEVALVSIEADPETASLQLTGEERFRQLRYSDEMMIWTTRVTDSIDIRNSDLVFVGYGIRAAEYGWDDYADLDVTGKTVLILVNDPGYVLQDPDLFNGKAMTYYGRWTYKFEEAARQGAAGAIIIHETGAAAYPWQTVDNSWSGAQLHLHSADGNMGHLSFESWLQHEVAKELLAAAGYELKKLEQAALSPEFTAVHLGWKVNVHIDNTQKESVSYNLGGIIPGQQHSDEAFIYMAHWDHLGMGVPGVDGEDVIFNGARDNASGIAGLIGLGLAFSALPAAPQRSVVFLAVTAEESGLLGSKWYVDHPPIPMNKTVAGLNMDNINVYGPTSDITLVGYGNSQLDNIMQELAASKQRAIHPEPEPEKGRFYRSDHFNFAKHGVPVLYPKPGVSHLSLGPDYMMQQNKTYTAQHYHTPEDEILESWDLNGLVADLQLYFRFGVEIADHDSWPQWRDGAEFKAIRESSMQQRAALE